MWMAGGGIRGGMTYGSTDDFSYNIEEDPVHIRDLNATILHCLGDHRKLRFQGLDQRTPGSRQKLASFILSDLEEGAWFISRISGGGLHQGFIQRHSSQRLRKPPDPHLVEDPAEGFFTVAQSRLIGQGGINSTTSSTLETSVVHVGCGASNDAESES